MSAFLDKAGLTYFWGKIKSALSQKVDKTSLSSVATSGSYDDLINKPTNTIVDDVLTSTSQTHALSANQGKILNDKIKFISDNIEAVLTSL